MKSVMRHLVLWLLILVAPTAPAANEAQAGIPGILVIGDSLSAGYGLRPGEGWVSLLEKKLAAQGYPHRVINASVSGETTRGGLARLPRALSLHQPDIVVIELGGNDGLRGFPVEVMRENLARMIDQSHAAGARVLLLGMHLPANYGEEYTRRFHQVFVDLAKAEQVPLVPFFLDGVAMQPEMMQADGIHPGAEAQEKMLENVWPELLEMLAAEREEKVAG